MEVGGQACDADLHALRAGVHRIALPSPMLASVNCWLIVDRPLTLVDCGLNWGGALDALETELRRLGFALEQLDLVLLTHEHVDHIGLAETIARRAGADVACHERLAAWLEQLPGSLEADDAWTAARLRAHGAPPAVVAAYEARMEMMRMLGSRPRPSVVLREGEELRLRDRTLRATLRPGHSPTDTLFADRRHDLLFAGDHLMTGARTTPYLTPRGGDDLAPARALRHGWQATAADFPTALALPGHGEPFAPAGAEARRQLERQRRRALRLLPLLDPPPRKLFELVEKVYPALTPSRAFLGMLELLAQLELLAAEGLVEEAAIW